MTHKRLNLLAMAMFFLTQGEAMAQTPQRPPAVSYANAADIALAGVFEAREKDWRNGSVVYQVLVDRFAPSEHLDAKRHLYPLPKKLRAWSEVPKGGTYNESHKVWSHEIDFWGGDLQSLSRRLDHVQTLGADVLYLNPIHLAYTNHKYDALDYMAISPEYGTRDDVKALAKNLHSRNMKLVFDGVFNHMGRNSPKFKSAQTDPKSQYRDWFVFGPQFAGGARAWALAENLPELNLENQAVRDHIYAKPDSVVRSYLRDGVDGWRLDVAFDIGFNYLNELTRAAHAEKPGSLVLGEIANYPKDWFGPVDGLLNFNLREIMLRTVNRRLEAPQAGRMIAKMVDDSGIEPMIKSWIYLDNHDTERLATSMTDVKSRKLAQVLMFTLPGSPNLYYGSELGMTGGDDPEMRAPMRWDWVTPDNPELIWTKELVSARKQNRALRVGNFRSLDSTKLLAFERYTDRVADSVIVLVNPSMVDVKDTLMITNSKIMDSTKFTPLMAKLSATEATALPMVRAGMLEVSVPAQSYLVLKPITQPPGGYSNYKRVQ